jgi:hypothetical protein
MAKMTSRQLVHLKQLADGNQHRAIRRQFSNSVYIALMHKGLAECIPTSPLKFRITAAGSAALLPQDGKVEL